MRANAVAILLAAPACQAIFPLEFTPPDPTFVVEGQLTRRFVVNDAAFLPRIDVIPYSDQELTATAVLDDGREVPVDLDYATGAFSFLRASDDQPYRLVLTFAFEGATTEYLSDQPRLTIAGTGFGRRDQIAAAQGTTIHGTISNVDWSSPGNTLLAYVTGTWNGSAVAVQRVSPFSYDQSWPLSLVEPAKFDRLYFAQFNDTGVVAFLDRVVAVDSPIVDGANTIDATAGSAAPLGCVHLNVQRDSELGRLTASYPGLVFPFQRADWAIETLPGSQIGIGGGFVLLVSSQSTVDDVQIGYNQPFPGLQSFAVMGISRQRDLSNGLRVQVGVSRFASVPMDCPDQSSPPSVLLASGTVPIASGIRLDGEPIDKVDEASFVIGTAPHELTWEIDTSDPDLYTVTLFEVAQKSLVRVHSWLNADRRLTIEPSAFIAGKTYLLEIESQIGFPDTETGDFETLRYPFSQSAGQSMTFTAM